MMDEQQATELAKEIRGTCYAFVHVSISILLMLGGIAMHSYLFSGIMACGAVYWHFKSKKSRAGLIEKLKVIKVDGNV